MHGSECLRGAMSTSIKKFSSLGSARSVRSYVGNAGLYVLATAITDAYFMGDTRIYVDDILTGTGFRFWEFGHVLWRPMGWLFFQILHPLTRVFVGDDLRVNVTLTLMALNWVSGLACVLLVHGLARRFSGRSWLHYLITVTFLFANAFLNYSQTGQPYVPGLACLLLGVYLLAKDTDQGEYSLKAALLAGLALAVSVGMWFPYSLAVPATVLAPVILLGATKSNWRVVSLASVGFVLVSVLIYGPVIVHLGIHNLGGLKAWITSAAHGIDGMKGVPRMGFGFARSLVNMGNDGRLFKRFVVKDPLNPVSSFDLFRFSLWKLGVFYIFLVTVFIKLIFTRLGKRAIVFFLLSAFPLVIFALYLFESGTIDRYLPLYPALFLSFAISLSVRWRLWAKVIVLIFTATMIISSVGAMSRWTLQRKQDAVVARIQDLQPLKANSRVITINQQDEVYEFNTSFPFHPFNSSGHLNTDLIVDPLTTQVLRWRPTFAAKTLALWEEGGDVWLTKRVFSLRPESDWAWVEGDDPRVSWSDIHNFFSQIDMEKPIGGDDGFMLVSPSQKNKEFLKQVVKEALEKGIKVQ